MGSPVNYIRNRSRYGAARFELQADELEFNVQEELGLFSSDVPGSAIFDAEKGYGDGTRFNVRIKPEGDPIWVRFNDASNDIIYIAGDEVYEEFNISCNNLFLTSAATTVQQVDSIEFVAELNDNYEDTYIKLFAFNPLTGATTVYALWFDVDNGYTQPTDDEVDVWLEVDITAADTDATIAAAAEVVVDGVTGVFTSDDSVAGTLEITHVVGGPRLPAEDVGSPTTVTTPTPGAGTATNVNIRVV